MYWPTNPSGRGRAGAPPPTDVPPKPPGELAREALAYRATDFLFSGALEGGIDRGIGPVADFVKATAEAGALSRTPFVRVAAPLIVKAPKIGADTTKAAENISRALNLGVSGLMFVEVESADEVRAGLAAMRFKSKGGTRSDDAGAAPGVLGNDGAAVQGRRPTSGRSIPTASCSTGRSSKARRGSRTSGRLRR